MLEIKFTLFELFEYKCVLEAFVHIHPIMIQIHHMFKKKKFRVSLFLGNSILKSSFSNQAALRFLSE